MKTRNTITRSPHGVIYSAFPGAYMETPQARIGKIERWLISKPSINNPEFVKKRIIERIRRQHKVRRGIYPAEENLNLITPHVGFYTLAPLTYVCQNCGEIVKYRGINEIRRGRGKCPNCKGDLSQTAHVWVHSCGFEKEIDKRRCPECGTWMRLHMPSRYDIGRWKYRCPNCKKEMNFMEICPECRDDPNLRSTEKRMTLCVCTSRYKKPMSMSIIDLPPKEETDEIVFARYCGLKVIEDSTKLEEERKRVEKARKAGLTEEQLVQIFGHELLESLRYDIKAEVGRIIKDKWNVLKEIADYQRVYENSMSQKGRVLSMTKFPDGTDGKEYAEILNEEFGIEDVVYVDSVKIVDVTYGYLPLTYNPDEARLVLFESQKRSGMWDVYTVAYNTEGLLIIFNKKRILKWLNPKEELKNDLSIKERLIHLTRDESDKVFTLIHSISHALMQTIHLYSGLSRDNFSEILFPHVPAILIVTKRSANLAALRTIYEYAHYSWFIAAKEKISTCIYDPICLESNGACHACLYIPEYCCAHWNQNLNRNAVLGNGEFRKFWEVE